MQGNTPFGEALLIDCTCDHFVKEHDSGGCYAEGGMCHCEGKLLYKAKGGEYMSVITKGRIVNEDAKRDELAASLATYNDDLRNRVAADAKRGITRLGRM